MRKLLARMLLTALVLPIGMGAQLGCGSDDGGGDPSTIGPPPGLPSAPTIFMEEGSEADPDQPASAKADSSVTSFSGDGPGQELY